MKKTFLISVILALLSTIFGSLYLYDIGQRNKSMSEPVKVIVAGSKIEQGKIITSQMLKEKLVPKQYAQPKHISSIKDFYIEGNPSFMSIVAFEEGEQITSTKILPITSDAGISNTIPDNKRAVTLIFDRDEVAGIISPGSRIDLISIIEYENKDKSFSESSVVVAQNLLVLAVGNDVIGGIKDLKNENITVNLPVTMAVSITEAQEIMLAREKGVIKIALRPAGDLSISHLEPVKMSDILKDASKSSIKQPNNAKEIQKSQKEALEIINKYSLK
jgi:pilus assembly protein CpaB